MVTRLKVKVTIDHNGEEFKYDIHEKTSSEKEKTEA